MDTERKFDVPAEGLTLTLEDLSARVTVRTGNPGVAFVNLSGPDKLLEVIKVEQPQPDQLTIKGERSSSGATIIQSFSSGRGGFSISQSVGGISGGSVVIGGGKGRRTIISSGDLVIVNGKVISGGGDDVTVIESDQPPSILVTVPPGTDLEVYDVEYCDATGLGGKLDLSLNQQDEATITGANGMKVSLNGQSECRISDASGDLRASLNGQSKGRIIGNLGDVDANVNGQSELTVRGNCHDFIATANGQSEITLSGVATGRVKTRENGQSSINV
jgi:hypothetical protein